MKNIKLSQGKYTIVDDSDSERVSQYKWCYKVSKKLSNGEELGYAVHGFWDSTRQQNKIVKLHRFILEITDPNILGDHINGNTLDNRRSNLRIVDSTLNSWNKRKFRGTSKYKGVYWDKQTNQWKTELGYYGRRIWLGRFDREEDAARAYQKAVLQYYG